MRRKRVATALAAILVGMTLGASRFVHAQDKSEGAAPSVEPQELTAVGDAFTYQGLLNDSGTPVTDTCDIQLSLWSAATDGSQVGTTITKSGVTVDHGLFTVALTFGASSFDGNGRWLAIAVRCPAGSGGYTTLSPRQELTAAPYSTFSVKAGTAAGLSIVLPIANGGTGSSTKSFVDLTTAQTVAGAKTFSSASAFTAAGTPFSVSGTGKVTNLNADLLDGLHAGNFMQHAQNVLVVATSGGDYTSVQAAVDAITTASASNPWLVVVAPGVYTGTVVMKPYVNLCGSGQETTILTSAASNASTPPTTATLTLAANSTVRDLTVENTGSSALNVAILATSASAGAPVTNVRAHASGAASGDNAAIYHGGASSTLTLVNVTALGEGSTGTNYGLYSYNGLRAVLQGGSYTGRGGAVTYGVYKYTSGTSLDAFEVTALGEAGTTNNGLMDFGATVTLHGGSFSASGGTDAKGIFNYGSNAEMDAVAISAVAEDASSYNRALYNGQYAVARLQGGSFTGQGSGSETYGIYNNSATLVAESAIATGQNGTGNNGLYSSTSATATLSGGTFKGSGGTTTRGIRNDTSSTLETHGATVIGIDGTSNYGLFNDNGATATLRGGTFTGRNGTNAWGIYTHADASYLEAVAISVLGTGGSSSNRGLESSTGADAVLTQSSLSGASSSVITTGGGGPVTLSNTRLTGVWGGNVTCTAVSRGTTFNASGCP